jgi:hypothetical protein
MMTTSEKATQKSITVPLLSVHHTSFLWASFACQEFVLTTTHRFVAPSGEGLPFLEISAMSPRSSSRSRVGIVEPLPTMHACPLGQSSYRRASVFEGSNQQRRIVAVGGVGLSC